MARGDETGASCSQEELNCGGYITPPGDSHRERSNFLNQQEPTVKWVLSTIKTAYSDSDVSSEKILQAVKIAIEEVDHKK